MPRKDNILNLPGFSIKKVSGYNPLVLEVNYRRQPRCIFCNQKRLRKKTSFMRTVRHEPIGHRLTLLQFKAHKFYCYECKRYFNQQFPGIGKYQRATERLHDQIFYHHRDGISQQSLSSHFKMGKATIERWYHQRYMREYQEIKGLPCPQILGIDEHSFSKKQGYVTTFCNLKKHKIFDVVKGRCAKDLKSYLEQLPGKEHVKVICIDLSN